MSDDKIFTAKVLEKIMPDSVNEQAKSRMEFCEVCDKFNKSQRKCLMCGCYMDLKVFIPDAQCPIKKW